jgi:hypothetical protein
VTYGLHTPYHPLQALKLSRGAVCGWSSGEAAPQAPGSWVDLAESGAASRLNILFVDRQGLTFNQVGHAFAPELYR